MASYDDWNKIDEDDEDELEDTSVSTAAPHEATRTSCEPVRSAMKEREMSYYFVLTARLPCWSCMTIPTTKT